MADLVCMHAQEEMRRFWAALQEANVPNVDTLLMLRAAAHEIVHEDLFDSMQFMCL